jgi:cation transport ATPase
MIKILNRKSIKMDVLVVLGGVVAIIFGLGVIMNKGFGNFLAGVAACGAGFIAIDTKSFIPLGVGFAILWVLRLTGLEK